VIEAVLAGVDTLAVMPTGAGKSLCYQLPALQLPGTTVIVSPLIALMKDQADKLEALGVDAAAVNSTLTREEHTEALDAIRRRATEFIFATPERLAEPEFLQLLERVPIDLFVIDEAHCISQWGHDFRPAFLEIASALRALGDPTLLALTATATDAVVEDIKAQLARPHMRVVNAGVFRPNLRFAVRQVTNPQERWAALAAAVATRSGCGIVYCATVKAATEVHARLCESGEKASLYHGRLGAHARMQAQEAFMNGSTRVMVATNAFGMGIDKPDIRFVVHYQMPASLEAYYQEAGRAGRDGAVAACTLLYDHADRKLHFFFLGGRYPMLADLRSVHDAIRCLAAARCRVTLREVLGAATGVSKRKTQVAFHLLRDAGLLGEAAATDAVLEGLVCRYRERAASDREKLERVTRYAHSALCRWKTILEYFGDPSAWDRCGTCDNCRNAPGDSEPAPSSAREAP